MANQVGSFIKKKLLGKNKNLISLDEPYEVMRRLLKGHDITGIIDAGASDGRILRRLLRKFPKAHAYAFEPNSLYFDSLKQYARENSRFHPYFQALSDCQGKADLHITQSPGNTSLLMPTEALKQIDSQGSCMKKSNLLRLMTGRNAMVTLKYN